MIKNVRGTFSPQTDPAVRRYRIRLARSVLRAYFISLVLWLLFLLIYVAIEGFSSTRLIFDFASITFLFSVGVITLRLINRNRNNLAGQLLASTLFAAITTSVLLHPEMIYLIGIAFLLPVLCVGAIVGGRSPFIYAIGASLITVYSWIQNGGDPVVQIGLSSFATSSIYLFSQAVVLLGTAAILTFLSSQVQETLQEMHTQAEKLTELAHTDPLTNLANRRYLIDQLEREFVRARRYRRPLSLLYLDLDGFKTINDRFGHLFGDEILRGAALALRAVLRSTDLLARIGGDEFAVLLPETTIAGAQGVTNKLYKALDAYGASLGFTIPTLTFCAGVGQLRADDETIDELLARSDKAQYEAKAAGRGQVRTQHELSQLPLFEGSTQPESRSTQP